MIEPEIRRIISSMDHEIKNAIEEFDAGSMEFLTHIFEASNLSEFARGKCLLKPGQAAVECDNFVVDAFQKATEPLSNKIEELLRRR